MANKMAVIKAAPKKKLSSNKYENGKLRSGNWVNNKLDKLFSLHKYLIHKTNSKYYCKLHNRQPRLESTKRQTYVYTDAMSDLAEEIWTKWPGVHH